MKPDINTTQGRESRVDEVQQATTILEDLYLFVLGALIRERMSNNNTVAKDTYRNLSKDAVHSFIEEFNKMHNDKINLSDKEKGRITHNFKGVVQRLDAQVSKEITTLTGKKPGEEISLRTQEEMMPKLRDKFKLENIKKAEQSTKSERLAASAKMSAVARFFYGIVESFRKYMKPPVVESFDKAIKGMTQKAEVSKGEDGAEKGESLAAKVKKQQASIPGGSEISRI